MRNTQAVSNKMMTVKAESFCVRVIQYASGRVQGIPLWFGFKR